MRKKFKKKKILEKIMNKSHTIIMVIILIFLTVLTFMAVKLSNIKRDLILAENSAAELHKYSESLQVAKAIIVEKSSLIDRLKADRELYTIIKKQKEQISALVETTGRLTVENLTLVNIIGDLQALPDGTYTQSYKFSHQPDENLSIQGETVVVYEDSLAKPLTSLTKFAKISFENVKLTHSHTYNPITKKYNVYTKTTYPYLTLDSTSVYYNIDALPGVKPKSWGWLVETSVYKPNLEKSENLGIGLGLGAYYRSLSLILHGRSDYSLGCSLQKRF
jgi:hypothetical protein